MSILILACAASFILGLVTLGALNRTIKRRHQEGRPRIPRWIRIAIALAALVAVIGGPVMIVKTIIAKANQNERLAEELADSGIAAQAIIVDLGETGTYYNNRPEIRVVLRVEPENSPSFQAQAELVFSVKDVQSLRVGAKVRVLFDPKNHARVALLGVAP